MPMARTTRTVNASKQLRAGTVAKSARIDEAGLGGPRSGKASATTRRAQARRDSAPARHPAAAAVATAETTAKAPAAKSSTARKAAKGAKAKAARLAPKKKNAGPVMVILVNTSRAAGASGARFDAHARDVIGSTLSRFAARLTRVEAHFSDENGPKTLGNDKRCRIEARPASQKPVSVSADAPTAEQALTAAAGKMKRLLATRLAVAKRPRR
jgi:hypothetical protein